MYNLQTDSGFYAADGIVVHNCRCTTAPAVKSARDLGWSQEDIDSSPLLQQLTGQPARVKSYTDFFDDQDAGFQRDVLGAARYELYKAGKADFDDFVSAVKGPGGTATRVKPLAALQRQAGSRSRR